MTDRLEEAHAPAAFHERVASLHQGEVARLKGGVAVARMATPDGRDGFRVASPSSYARDGIGSFDYGDQHRTAEDAVRAAFRTSAASSDPESIGGVTRLSTYGPVDLNGTPARVRDFTTDGKAVVELPGGGTRTCDPASLARPANRLLAGLLEGADGDPLREEWSEAARAAALARRKAEHPDWDWGGREIPRERGTQHLDAEVQKLRAAPDAHVHLMAIHGTSLERLQKHVEKRHAQWQREDQRQRVNLGIQHPAGGSPRTQEFSSMRTAIGRALTAKYAQLREAAYTDGQLTEAADSMAKASTPEPFSSSKTSNWVARAGGLPAYIQHIAHDLMEKRGKSESEAIQMAIGIVKNWASGKGNVDAGTRAAASKAVAEWEAMKAKNAAKKGARVAEGEARSCPDCDGKVPAGARSCPECGHRMTPVRERVVEDDFAFAAPGGPLACRG